MTNGRRFFFLIGLLLLCVVFSYARGGKEKASVIRVSGLVRLVGSGAFPEIVISSPDGQWYIAKDEMRLLHDYQHRNITVEGTETVIELKSAGGYKSIKRRELKNVKIIMVESLQN